jgi:hypothetical protein
MSEEVFSGDNIPKSNWMKFEKVGDQIIGTFISKYVKKGDEGFADQVVYTLNNVKINGEQMPHDDEYNMGVSIREGSANFVNNKFAKVIPGQRMGLLFEKEIPPKKKGFHPAKSFMPNVFSMDSTFTPEESFRPQVDETADINDIFPGASV